MGFDRYGRDGDGDYRNGEYTRLLHTEVGDINVQIPRDRKGKFKQHTVPPYARHSGDLVQTVITLYSGGITTREISDILWRMYGQYYSPAQISSISDKILEDVDKFHKRDLTGKKYVATVADSTYIRVRRDSVQAEALHVLIGITLEGVKEVIDYRLYPTESAEHYEEMLRDVRARGAEEVLMVVTDSLSGIKEAVGRVYPMALHQACWVHVLNYTPKHENIRFSQGCVQYGVNA